MPTQTFFQIPFASSGDIATIPGAAQSNGSISFTDGYTINYQQNPLSFPGAINIDRLTFNELMLLITQNIQTLQLHGIPYYIPSAQNGGSPVSYDINSIVRFTGGWASTGDAVYISLIGSNTTTPATQANWGLITQGATAIAGEVKTVSDPVNLPTGYIWANGQTIGNASSNATGRANADTAALFTIYWGYSPAVLPMFTSLGAAAARGVSAASDYAANNAMAIPNLMGCTVAGLDGMGGAPNTNNLTLAGSNISGTTPGATGGAQNVSLTSGQNGAHAHGPGGLSTTFRTIGGPPGQWVFQYSAGTPDGYENDNATTGTSGSGSPHLNVQPTIVLPIIIALGTT